MKIAVLGAGMVGRTMAIDLASAFDVTSFDVSEESIQLLKERNPSIQVRQANLKDYNKYPKLLEEFDIVVTAVPGFMGFETLKTVINLSRKVSPKTA